MKKLKQKILDILLVLFHPSCWIQIHPYSKQWDKKLNDLMLNNKFKNINKFRARLEECEMWIENHPYSSMTPNDMNVRPKRSTILRAHDKLMNDLFNNENKE